MFFLRPMRSETSSGNWYPIQPNKFERHPVPGLERGNFDGWVPDQFIFPTVHVCENILYYTV
jgi:hypothetical protein